MRSFYSTQTHIRLFIFGVPEGWQAAMYDLRKKEWIDKGSSIHGTIREAKTNLEEKATAVLGTKVTDLDWH